MNLPDAYLEHCYYYIYLFSEPRKILFAKRDEVNEEMEKGDSHFVYVLLSLIFLRQRSKDIRDILLDILNLDYLIKNALRLTSCLPESKQCVYL